LKNKGRKKNHERGQKQRSKSEDNNGGCTYEDLALLLPSGFDRKEVGDNGTTPLSSPLLPPFKYFDAGFDEGTQVLEYLRFGRGVKVKHSRKEAIEEYDNTMKHFYQKTNLGGCITRCYLPSKHNIQKTIENAFPFNVSVDGSSSSVVYFVVGLGHDFVFDIIDNIKNEEDNNDKCSFDDSSSDVEEDNDDAIEYLVSTVKEENNNNNNNNNNNKIVGVFADLDYTYMTTSSRNKNKNKNNKVYNHDRDIQLRKLRCTVKAAIEIGCAIQIRILPSCSSSSSSASSSSSSNSSSSNNGNDDDGGDEGEHGEDMKDPYLLAIQDLAALLATLLAETTTTNEINNIYGEDENGNNNKLLKLKIHLSCWNGKSEHMMVLLKAFPDNLYIGFDSTITFQKATHIHECAFDVPLNKLVLETGSPSIIPSCIANSIDTRYAFCHSGYIPIIANEIAKYSSKNINNLNINNLKENVCATTDAVDDEDDTTTTTAKEIEVEAVEAGGISTTTTTLSAEMVARIASTNTMSLYGIS
jgi:Tat protein secretion system quality control protein TatD with DNase activity